MATITRTNVAATVRRAAGFTLIEVLVVVVIVAIVTGALLLSLSLDDRGELKRALRQLQRQVGLACERAALTSTPVALDLAGSDHLVLLQWIDGRWQDRTSPAAEGIPAPRASGGDNGAGISIIVVEPVPRAAGQAGDSPAPLAVCEPSGSLTPFTVDLVDASGQRLRVSAAIDGTVTVAPGDGP